MMDREQWPFVFCFVFVGGLWLSVIGICLADIVEYQPQVSPVYYCPQGDVDVNATPPHRGGPWGRCDDQYMQQDI